MYLEHYINNYKIAQNKNPNLFKKYLIKILTFWIFPKVLRQKSKRWVRYWLGEGPKPETFLEKYHYLKTRENYLKKNQNKDIFSYRIISLGSDCFSRTIPTLWGLKPRKRQGEKGYPFDLSDHPLPAIVKYLENDFRDYFESLEFNEQLQYWLILKDGILYCHEDDCNKDSKETIIKRFSQRINNLRYILQEDNKPTLFISNFCPLLAPTDITEIKHLYERLYAKIKELRQTRPFEFLIVDTSGKLKNIEFSKGINLLSCDFLPQPYVWHQPQYQYKKSGLKFELLFINKIEQLLEKMTN